MEVLSDLIMFDLSFADSTSGNEVETLTEECCDSELIKWDACGRPLCNMGSFWMEIGTFFLKS